MSHLATRFMSALTTCLQALAIVGLCIWPAPAYADVPSEGNLDQVYSRFANIERGLSNLDKLEARLQREHTDPLARARSLGNDPDSIIADVTDSISYLPYSGSLRAADGTLSSLSGNAIDQAVLLATMLNRAGLEARLVKGQISAEDGKALVKTLSRPSSGQPAFTDEAIKELKETFSEEQVSFEDLPGTRTTEDNESLKAELDEQQEQLLAALGTAAPPEESDLPQWIIKAAQDYWWVQYRDEPAGAWSNAHPAWPGGEAPPSLEGVEDAYYNALPDSAVQRITIRLYMEIKEGDGETKTLKLAELEEVPGPELARNPVTLSIIPDTLASNPQADITAAMEQAQFMLVGLNGQRAHDPFTLSGTVVPPEALGAQAYGMADLFATVSDRGESAIAALSGDENTDVLAIRSLRLDITSQAPGLPDRHDTRILYDATDSNGSIPTRPSGHIAAGLTGTYLIGARTGRITDTGVAAAMVEQARGIANLIEYDVFRDMVQPEKLPPVSEVISDLDPSMPLTLLAYAESRIPESDNLGRLRWPLARLGLNTGAMGMEEPSILMPVRPLVRMIGVEGAVAGTDGEDTKYGMRNVVDLISSPVLALTADAGGMNPREGLRAGLWMSRLEGDITPAEDNTTTYDTETILQKANEEEIPLVTLAALDDEKSEKLALPAEFGDLNLPHVSRKAIQRDLESGFTVLVHKSLPEGVPYAAWWRVNQETGETLAMLDTGRGAEYQEFLNLLCLVLNTMSTYLMAEDIQKCMSDDFNKKGGSLACCLVTSAIPMGPAGAGMVGSLKVGHPAVAFAVAFISINAAFMGGIVGQKLNLSGKCYE
ncbi:transglutaminase family protein [Henriciella sp.]|uniref:transglutaminase-like domain-containing protein n=1 Tax=Henriciella sp. TaxID=1968823 RepID=UPI002606BF2D|nr:transglutaminase family protein [Henriciella sp.]